MGVKVGIIDYGLGNVRSVKNALERLACKVFISSDYQILSRCDLLVMPGVGAFPAAMRSIEEKGLMETISSLTLEEKKPFLGICLGMQILAQWGEEYGHSQGLGLIPGEVRPLPVLESSKVPHVGWSRVDVLALGEKLFARRLDADAYYFDHSYYFDVEDTYCAAKVSWEIKIPVAVVKENIMGVQFHPEKSQNAGLRLLKGFVLYAQTMI